MKTLVYGFLSLVTIVGGATSLCAQQESATPLRAAIFVQNRANEKADLQVDIFSELLSARLTEKGFTVLSPDDVIGAFRKTKGVDDSLEQILTAALQSQKSESTIEGVLTGSSALRIAQNINADFLIVATILSVNENARNFKGYGLEQKVIDQVVRVSLKVLEGNQGGSVYGDVVTVNARAYQSAGLSQDLGDSYDGLFEAAAAKIADQIQSKIDRIRHSIDGEISLVPVNIDSNIADATVEVDGVALGSAPNTFQLKPGLHRIRVSKEHYVTWERAVNAFGGLVLKAQLELSAVGIARKRELDQHELTVKAGQAAIDIRREQSAASAEAERARAAGEKTMLENSHIRFEGEFDSLAIGAPPVNSGK